MVRRVGWLLIGCFLTVPSLRAQQPGVPTSTANAIESPARPGRKLARAARVPAGSVQIDGSLDDDVWSQATAIGDFTQRDPVEGAPATQRTEVRFLYDDDALYVGARMYSSDPSAIQAPLGRRDQAGDVTEQFVVSMDTFLDRRTSYTFGVTAAGVRIDRFSASDNEGGDNAFDPVWRASTRVDDQGWTAELWIPFTQLRFNDRPVQVWGINARRFIPTLEEETYWILVPRTEVGWASRFGDLEGIEGVRPSRRIEMLPFVVGSATRNGDRVAANPFDDGKNLVGRMGLDLKMGVGPNLTLDATFNPDFGQVEADPAEVNLSDFATRFPERRPFFTEGSGLLNLSHPNVFYSRRIGAPPIGRATGDFIDYPSDSRILGAAKLTGRLPSGTSIGVLAAVTDRSYADVADTLASGPPQLSDVQVGPRTAYSIAKVEQEFGSGSHVSLLGGGIYRDFGGQGALADLSTDYALVTGTDGLWRINEGEYEWSWAIIGSYLEGDPDAVARVQRSSSHYLQRPDRTGEWRYDPFRSAMAGWSVQTGFNKTSGRHWLFGTSTKIDHPMFDTNDIAQLNGADGIMPGFNVTYRETQPGRLFRSYSVRLNQGNEWNFEMDRQNFSVGTNVNVTWRNFWTTSASFSRNFRVESAALTRGGPLMGQAARWSSNFNFGNPSTAQTRVSGGVSFSGDELGGHAFNTNMNVSVRPGPQWQLSARPSYSSSKDSQQYVTSLAGGRPETFGRRYIFSFIDRTQYAIEFRASFTLKPDLNLDVYAEPFAASGRFYDFGELTESKSIDRITYGQESGTTVATAPNGDRTVTWGSDTFTITNRDFNTTSFQSNVVLRWEWRPGSTFYAVWQQNRDDTEGVGRRADLGDLFGSVGEDGSNILLLKASFWLPVG
ncbi:MAG: DUF5916 domain-containing protein [Longimicrobiales bacterium]